MLASRLLCASLEGGLVVPSWLHAEILGALNIGYHLVCLFMMASVSCTLLGRRLFRLDCWFMSGCYENDWWVHLTSLWHCLELFLLPFRLVTGRFGVPGDGGVLVDCGMVGVIRFLLLSRGAFVCLLAETCWGRSHLADYDSLGCILDCEFLWGVCWHWIRIFVHRDLPRWNVVIGVETYFARILRYRIRARFIVFHNLL